MEENNKLKKTVFISYSRKDIDLVQSFLDVGDNRFFKTKIDQADKKVGADWRVTIRDMINSSDGAILFISKHALDPKSPINTEEIPLLIKRNNDPEDKFEFFPVFLDYVDKSTVDSYTFKEFGTDKEIRLFDKYDIWNIEANDPNDIGQEMPSEMSENKLENFWSDLNLKLSDALKGKTVNKLGEIKTWNSNKAKLKEVRKNKFRNFGLGTLITAAFISLFYLVLRPDESLQTSEVFNIGGSVQLGVLTTGDCFNKIDNESELNWNTYVQYRACDLLHDGEVFYRENQLDFGDNIVSYSNLLNFLMRLVIMNSKNLQILQLCLKTI